MNFSALVKELSRPEALRETQDAFNKNEIKHKSVLLYCLPKFKLKQLQNGEKVLVKHEQANERSRARKSTTRSSKSGA